MNLLVNTSPSRQGWGDADKAITRQQRIYRDMALYIAT